MVKLEVLVGLSASVSLEVLHMLEALARGRYSIESQFDSDSYCRQRSLLSKILWLPPPMLAKVWLA